MNNAQNDETYETLADIMMDCERRVVALGVRAAIAAVSIIRCEAAFTNDLAETAREARQFLLELSSNGTRDVARRRKKSDRTIRRMKVKAFNKIGHSKGIQCPLR